jgi:hypothetical protein
MPGPSERANRGKSMHLQSLQEIRPTFNEFADAGIEPSVPTTPTLRPKLRNKPRMSFSMAIAFFCRSVPPGAHGASDSSAS